MEVPKAPEKPMNHGVGADDDGKEETTLGIKSEIESSDALSMIKNKTVTKTIATREVAFLCADKVSSASVNVMKSALENAGGSVKIIAPHLGTITTEEGETLPVDQSYLIAASVLFDAVFVPAGKGIAALKGNDEVAEFINDAFKHCKYIAADGEGIEVLTGTNAAKDGTAADAGVITNNQKGAKLADTFIKAMGNHRFWEREDKV